MPAATAAPRPPVSTAHLRTHRFAALEPGPRLVVTGAVHGNETAGTHGIARVLAEIEAGQIDIVRGSVTYVPVTNPLAFNHGRRTGDRNLNRRLLPTAEPREYEDRIANVLCPLLAEHDVLLDLHSFRSPGAPFVLRGPADHDGTLEPFGHAAAEARLCAHLGVQRIVDGWMSTYATGVARRRERALTPGAVNEHPAYGIGTTEYMRSVGGYAVTLECGQHEDSAGPGVAAHAIRQTLALLGIADAATLPLVPPQGPFECLSLVEVTDRHHADDRFVKRWTSFDPLAAGELIAVRADGSEVRAPEAGCIVFPDHAALPGHEWFYRARVSGRSVTTAG
jgi:predicted deacylase